MSETLETTAPRDFAIMRAMGQTILVLEDDPAVRDMLQAALQPAGHRVIATDRLATAWHMFISEKPDLAILDVSLPDGTGIEFCEKIRKHKDRGQTPVIMLTAQSDFESKSSGFTAGADQYIVKPISPQEIVLWVDALLRRVSYADEPEDVLSAGGCEIDVKAHLVRYGGQTIANLTKKEFELLYYLMKRRPRVLSRKAILTGLWHTITVDHVVDTHLTNLRKKLPTALSDKIQTIPGKGFRFLE